MQHTSDGDRVGEEFGDVPDSAIRIDRREISSEEEGIPRCEVDGGFVCLSL